MRTYADSAGYVLEDNFFPGAVEVNSFGGKTYWMSFISEPIVPIIAYNKTKVQEMGLPEPTDDMTFAELAEWAQQGTTDDVFGYSRATVDLMHSVYALLPSVRRGSGKRRRHQGRLPRHEG